MKRKNGIWMFFAVTAAFCALALSAAQAAANTAEVYYPDDEGTFSDLTDVDSSANSSLDVSVLNIGTAWESMEPLPAGRVFHATAAWGKYVYVIGGCSDAGGSTKEATVFRYDTDTDTWDTVEPMPAALSMIGAVAVNGKIYVPGDADTATTYVYDIVADSWSSIAANNGYSARSQYSIVARQGKVYVLGGIVGGSASTNEVWILNPGTETWSVGVPMLNSRAAFGAAAVGSEIIAAGGVLYPGFAPDMTAEKFDGSSWSYVAPVPDGGGAYTRWTYQAYGHGEDGLWFAAGRRDAGWSVLNHAGYYDLETDTWYDSPAIPAINQGRVYLSGVVAPDDYFYVIGGRDNNGSIIYANVERLEVGYPAAETMRIPDTGDPAERVCNPRSYSDPGNGIVRDNTTGLEWLPLTSPDTYTWQGARDYVEGLNDNETLGYDDWRLPSIAELSSLVDSGRYAPAIDPVFSAGAAGYWSSTVWDLNTDFAWMVDFSHGIVNYYDKNNQYYVLAVRRARYGLSGSYVDNTDGTVTDTATDLMWLRCNYGQAWDGDYCTGSAQTHTWQEALEYIQGLNDNTTYGYNDWRMPTKNEVLSLMDYGIHDPSTVFPDMVSSYYWTATTNALLSDYAWIVSFYIGEVSYNNKDGYSYVRAVRGGPCRADGDWCRDNSDCDDGVFCNGTETCEDSICTPGEDPCSGGTPVCDEAGNRCVECLTDGDCDAADR